jgi:hypothetical protein
MTATNLFLILQESMHYVQAHQASSGILRSASFSYAVSTYSISACGVSSYQDSPNLMAIP